MRHLRYLNHFVVLYLLLASANVLAEQKTADVDLSTGRTVYTVGYAHLDTQWRWDYTTTINEYIPNTMRDNFARFEKYPNYIFNFSGSNRYRMMKEYYPADYQRVKKYVADGRWFPCGSSVEECDVMATSAESIIRQVLYGNHYFNQEFGKTSAEFMLPDCFGFSASLPSLLAHCGIKGFSTQKLSWGSAVGVPFDVGVWEGLDGSSVIAALNPGSYNGDIEEDFNKNEPWLNRIEKNGKAYGLYADYHYYGVGDQGGAPREFSIDRVEKAIAAGGPLKVISANAEQMFLDIKPEQEVSLPRYKGDILLTEHSAGSITSQAYMKRWNRMNELLADSAERSAVFVSWMGGAAYPQKKLNDAWTLVMGGQFHDILPGTSIPRAYEFSWNDEVLAMNQFSSVLQNAVGSIASELDTRAKGRAIVVYNSLSITREDIVKAVVTLPENRAIKVVGPDGKITPSQIIGRDKNRAEVLFVAKVPSVGFAVYDVQPVATSAKSTNELIVTNTSIENARYRVAINADGDVGSIYDKLAKREMLSSPMRLAFTYEKPESFPAWNIGWTDQQRPPRGYVNGPAKVSIVENGPARVALQIEREAEGSKFVQTIRLSAGSAGDRVEFANVIDWRGKECNLKFEMPLSVSNANATYNWETGTVERGNNDSKKYEVPSHQWFDLTDAKGDYGVTVLSPFKYGSDKPNDNTLRLTLLRTPGVREHFKDQATQDWGRHEITFALAGHVSSWRDAGTDWQALRLEQSLFAFQSAAHNGKLGKSKSFANISNPRVRIMALKKAEDSNEIIARLVEMDGRPARNVSVRFAGAITSAREVNGQEQPIGDARIFKGKLMTDLKANGLRTFAITFAKPAIRVESAQSESVAIPYDRDVTTADGEVANIGFDKDSVCLAAEMLPAQIIDNGITFQLAPNSKSAANSVTCKGQTISLPKANFDKIAILAAGSDGDQPAIFEVDGKQFKLTIQDWGGFIGQWDNRVWTDSDGNFPYGYKDLKPGFIKRDPVAWFASHRHMPDGKNQAYSYSYLYRYIIDAPRGAMTLKLPDNQNIHIMAISVGSDPASACSPAQLLYD